ncbi:hypothetical protein ACGF8B_41895 [Streptomyces sp. NPDC047917]|uniref:hypothetical protein n=1 Tax=Streptomyces sp. NPDC047917 TaxID=3365491 RepID=UPI003714F907
MPDTHRTQPVPTDTRGTAQRLRTAHHPTGILATYLPPNRAYTRLLAAQALDASPGDHDQDDAGRR